MNTGYELCPTKILGRRKRCLYEARVIRSHQPMTNPLRFQLMALQALQCSLIVREVSLSVFVVREASPRGRGTSQWHPKLFRGISTIPSLLPWNVVSLFLFPKSVPPNQTTAASNESTTLQPPVPVKSPCYRQAAFRAGLTVEVSLGPNSGWALSLQQEHVSSPLRSCGSATGVSLGLEC